MFVSRVWFFSHVFSVGLHYLGQGLSESVRPGKAPGVQGVPSMLIIIRAVSAVPCQHLVTHSAAGKGRRNAAQKLQHLQGKRICSKTNKGFHSLHRLTQWDTVVPGVRVKFHWFQAKLTVTSAIYLAQNYRSSKSTGFSGHVQVNSLVTTKSQHFTMLGSSRGQVLHINNTYNYILNESDLWQLYGSSQTQTFSYSQYRVVFYLLIKPFQICSLLQ